ncbi:MAG: ATP-binding cassette domain-containing protein, partial [Eubacteriales bacterium]
KKIGLMLGGDASLFSHLTAYENIEYFAKLNGSSAPKRMIEEITERLGMRDYINKPVDGFSRGMRQKVIFASSTIHNPEIILLDEPSTGLDIFAINEVHDLIKTYKKEGKTIIISSHNMDEVKKLADKVIIMNKGSVMQYDELEKLFDRYGTHSLDFIFKETIKEEAEART